MQTKRFQGAQAAFTSDPTQEAQPDRQAARTRCFSALFVQLRPIWTHKKHIFFRSLCKCIEFYSSGKINKSQSFEILFAGIYFASFPFFRTACMIPSSTLYNLIILLLIIIIHGSNPAADGGNQIVIQGIQQKIRIRVNLLKVRLGVGAWDNVK